MKKEQNWDSQKEAKKTEDFEQLYRTIPTEVKNDTVFLIDYRLPYPKEEFLGFLTERRGALLHGTSNQDLETLEPRQANDEVKEFGNRKAVYAVTDPVLPIFYSIRDRDKIKGMVESGVKTDPRTGDKKYEFRLPRSAAGVQFWTRGIIYILDRRNFTQGTNDHGEPIDEWASELPVKPIAKLEVGPEDFRFADDVEFHDEHDQAL